MIAWFLAAQLTWAGVLSDGNAAFEDGRLDEAISLWSEVDRPSGRLLYNLGNAYYRKGDRSRALACYRQAQRLRPRDGHIHHNLAMVRTELETVAPPGVSERAWVNVLTPAELGLLGLALVLAGSGLVVGRRTRRAPGVAVGSTALLAVGLGLSVEAWQAGGEPPVGVVVVERAQLRDSPRPDGDVVWTFNSGSELAIEQAFGDFRLVRDGDGRRGWVPQSAVWWPGQAEPAPAPAPAPVPAPDSDAPVPPE